MARTARTKTAKPARGDFRYVTVKCMVSGEEFKVLTRLINIGWAVVAFTPNNHHLKGKFNGMMITHDDIKKGEVFSSFEEFQAYALRGKKLGWTTKWTPATIIED